MRIRGVRVGWLVAGFLLGAACVPRISGPGLSYRIKPNQVTDSGLALARTCLTRESLPVVRDSDRIILNLVPGASFDFDGRISQNPDLPAMGMYLRYNIWVAEKYADLPRLWGHEYLHAIGGLSGWSPGTHHPAFARCNLLVI